jgi:hypothetical protein
MHDAQRSDSDGHLDRELDLSTQQKETDQLRHEVERLRKRVKEARNKGTSRYGGWG